MFAAAVTHGASFTAIILQLHRPTSHIDVLVVRVKQLFPKCAADLTYASPCLLNLIHVVWNGLSCYSADILEKERENAAVFQELPFHYNEVAHLLLRHARDCFEDLYRVSYSHLQSPFQECYETMLLNARGPVHTQIVSALYRKRFRIPSNAYWKILPMSKAQHEFPSGPSSLSPWDETSPQIKSIEVLT